jgi:hypothetical protein
MSEKLDFEVLAADLLKVLQTHGLTPDFHGIVMSLAKGDFDKIAADHPRHHNHSELILVTAPKWFVQIKRLRELSDYPPGAILEPPADG